MNNLLSLELKIYNAVRIVQAGGAVTNFTKSIEQQHL